MKKKRKVFGGEPIKVGVIYEARVTNSPPYPLVKPRSVELDSQGFVFIGCSYKHENTNEERDADGFCVVPSIWMGPYMLRRVFDP